jgi:hypothetical protein
MTIDVLATVRPDDQNFPLFLHVFGAMVLVGGLLIGSSALAFARGEARLLRIGYWSLLALSLPGWVLMRIAGQWIYSKEGWDDVPDEAEPAWLGIGFVVGDLGGLLLVVSLVVGGIGVYRLRAGEGSALLKVTLVLALLLLVAFLVAAWAMSGKPD